MIKLSVRKIYVVSLLCGGVNVYRCWLNSVYWHGIPCEKNYFHLYVRLLFHRPHSIELKKKQKKNLIQLLKWNESKKFQIEEEKWEKNKIKYNPRKGKRNLVGSKWSVCHSVIQNKNQNAQIFIWCRMDNNYMCIDAIQQDDGRCQRCNLVTMLRLLVPRQILPRWMDGKIGSWSITATSGWTWCCTHVSIRWKYIESKNWNGE